MHKRIPGMPPSLEVKPDGRPIDAPPAYEESLKHPVAHAAQYQYVTKPQAYAAPQASLYTQQQQQALLAQQQQQQQQQAALLAQHQAYSQLAAAQQQASYLRQPVYYAQQPGQSVYQATQPQQLFYPGQQVVIPNAYDAGARFSATSPPSIPPPPPGVAPNAAQLAMQSASNVVAGQKKPSFFTGGSGAGATFW